MVRSQAIVKSGKRGLFGAGISIKRRRNPRPSRVIVNVCEQGLHPWDELLAVEKLANRHCSFERSAVTGAPRLRTEVGIEIGGCGYAAGKFYRTRLHQDRFG